LRGTKLIRSVILADLTSTATPALLASLSERLTAARGGEAVPEPLLNIHVERIALGTGDPIHIVRPDNWRALRDAEQAADQPIPYWAVPWPSGLALARTVAADPPARGTRVLELGCGLALPSVVAARAGADVLATDASTDAAVFAAHNMALNETEGEVRPADWREVADDLAHDPFPLVLAADVLYLRENVDSLLRLLPRLVAPGGEIWLADPHRAGTEEFLPVAKRLWRVEETTDATDEQISIYRLLPR
jgi:predicted nicotinamide N-methyase